MMECCGMLYLWTGGHSMRNNKHMMLITLCRPRLESFGNSLTLSIGTMKTFVRQPYRGILMQGKTITVSKERWTIVSGGKVIASRTQVSRDYSLAFHIMQNLRPCLVATEQASTALGLQFHLLKQMQTCNPHKRPFNGYPV